MKLLKKELVQRYYVQMDRTEALILMGIGFLPPDASIPAHMWMTEQEVMDTAELLGWKVPADFFKSV